MNQDPPQDPPQDPHQNAAFFCFFLSGCSLSSPPGLFAADPSSALTCVLEDACRPGAQAGRLVYCDILFQSLCFHLV